MRKPCSYRHTRWVDCNCKELGSEPLKASQRRTKRPLRNSLVLAFTKRGNIEQRPESFRSDWLMASLPFKVFVVSKRKNKGRPHSSRAFTRKVKKKSEKSLSVRLSYYCRQQIRFSSVSPYIIELYLTPESRVYTSNCVFEWLRAVGKGILLAVGRQEFDCERCGDGARVQWDVESVGQSQWLPGDGDWFLLFLFFANLFHFCVVRFFPLL